MVYGTDGKRIKNFDLIKCKQCRKSIVHIYFPWDDGGGQEVFCLECKPITEEEQEHLDYAKYISKKRKLR